MERISLSRAFSRILNRDLNAMLAVAVLLVAILVGAGLYLTAPAPPDTINIACGPRGSSFYLIAERYAKVLARNGVKLNIIQSGGSLDNLKRLRDPKSHVDVALVQGGVASPEDTDELVSLGSLSYLPILVAYTGKRPIKFLADLKGKRIAIGPEGSGAHAVALAILKQNGIEPGGITKLSDQNGDEAIAALQKHEIDAAFMQGESSSISSIRTLFHSQAFRIYDFTQADAYVRRFRYLSRIDVPPGAFDIGENLPPAKFTMLAPTVELIARPGLHPALSDLLIEAAQEIHGRGSLFASPGEFPAPAEHEFRISDDAKRYYKSGKSLAYQHLPFWLASLLNRLLVVFVPVAIVLVPGLKMVPKLYAWRMKSRIHRRYVELMALERAALEPQTEEARNKLLERLDAIEKTVIGVKLPGAFADEVYILREHIDFVRNRLAKAK